MIAGQMHLVSFKLSQGVKLIISMYYLFFKIPHDVQNCNSKSNAIVLSTNLPTYIGTWTMQCIILRAGILRLCLPLIIQI